MSKHHVRIFFVKYDWAKQSQKIAKLFFISEFNKKKISNKLTAINPATVKKNYNIKKKNGFNFNFA